MKAKELISKPYVKSTLLVIAGLFIGWLIFHDSRPGNGHEHEQEVTENKNTIWTCAMHPQIRMDKPGKCPICGMDLVPLEQNITQIDPNAIEMTEEALKLADVQTTVVSLQQPVKEIRLYGKIQADERLVQTQPAHVPGRIEKLLVNFTGEEVRRGQVIARIYSPSLITAQEELLEALKMKGLQPQILEAATEKLRQWKFTDSQIAEIIENEKIKTVFDVFATVSGIVINKQVNVGDYITQGTPLYEIADLSNVWALFDAYESDLPWIKQGNQISFTLQSQPGKVYSGKVSFIDPVINPLTRVARVRIEVNNAGNNLKPEMFATGIIKASLVKLGNSLVIPQSAVLWTGTRSVVYVKIPQTEMPGFIMREVTLGPALSNSYVVLEGLSEGEEIVTNGTFSVDAAAQLAGKRSMMNPEGSKQTTGHNHGDTDGQPMDKTPDNANKTYPVDKLFKTQLTDYYKEYLKLTEAFVGSNAEMVQKNSKVVLDRLARIDMKLIKGDAHMEWMDARKKMEASLKAISGLSDIEKQRNEFGAFNLALYKSIKAFGLDGGVAYYQYCPMANRDKGAYWFSSSEKIRNPYFGEAMLGCGETRETIR